MSAHEPPKPAEAGTPTDSLVVDFHTAWNAEDVAAMAARLQPTAFFASPYQLRYGRDAMRETVLITNPPAFKNIRTTEHHSYVSETLAWSIGELVSDLYDEGEDAGESTSMKYLYVFTPDEQGSWKTQMLVYHEECQ